jgi:hypothetical protein
MLDMALLSVLRSWYFRDGMPVSECMHRYSLWATLRGVSVVKQLLAWRHA